MKKNVKNKILAFSMASAMIVPNVAVVFAEAPKAGSAKTAEKASETKTVHVTYYYTDDKGVEQNAGMTSITVDASTTVVGTELLKNGVPEGYEICRTGDEYIGESTGDSYLMIEVRPVEKKTINVTYYYVDEKGENHSCGTDSVKIDASATTFNTSVLKNVPEGYEICRTGDEYVGKLMDSANIEVRKKAVEKKTINVTYYYVDEKGENHPCGTDSVKLDASATTFNNTTLTNVPEGYEICRTGDEWVGDTADGGFVNIEVRKIEKVTTLHVNFETVDGTVVGEKTFEKTSTDEEDVVFALGDDIVLPEGYHWVDYNDQIKNVTLPAGATGGHYMYVEQDETKTVLNVTFETKDGEVVGTTSAAKEFTIDEEGVKVADFVVGEDFALPEGYHLADADQQTIRVNGLVGGTVVVVEKDAEPAPAPSENPKKDDTKKDDTKKEETKKEETKKASKTADTADTSDVAAYAIPLVMSMVAISAIVVGRKKLS